MSFRIRSWNVSYYQPDQRRWVYGLLTCSPLSVTFQVQIESVVTSAQNQESQQQNNDIDPSSESSYPLTLSIKYSNIKLVRKAKSMLIFPAVIVETSDGAEHWFSSLPDKYSVYNILHHFVQHTLLQGSGKESNKKPDKNPVPQTELGKKLLRSVEDSERTFAAAAGELHGQGRQLDRAGIHLLEIHEDLDVADRLLSGLNTYLGHWSLPTQYECVDPIHIGKDDILSDQDLEVLSSELSKDQWQTQQLSILRVTESSLTLLNNRQRPLHTFHWMNLSRVFVVSPWEVVLTKREAGKPSVSVSVVSAALLPVLQVLQKKVSHLVDFQDVPKEAMKAEVANEEKRLETGSQITNSPLQSTNSQQQHANLSDANSDFDLPNSSLQLQKGKQQQEVVSEAELLALRGKLGGLKIMASAVGDELTTQNKTLDDMIQSVDLANSRLHDANQRIKKLT